MHNFILSLFIKDYQNTSDPVVRRRYGVLAGWSGIAANFLLFIIKITVGIISGSIAVIADAINNLSDTASSLLTLVGFKLSGKPADREHPYGHARLEYVFGLIVSLAVTILGLQTLINSVQKILSGGGNTVFSTPAVIIIACSIFIKVFMALFVKKLGGAIESGALIATAADSVSDVITTTTIVIGMLVSPYTGKYTDGVLGVCVAVYIIILGIKLVINASSPLLGKAPSKEQIDSIEKKLKSFDGVLGIHDMVIHSYGAGKCFVSVHVEVDKNRDIMESHEMIDNIESYFMRETGIDMVIHMDPVCTDDEHLNWLRDKLTHIMYELSKKYGIVLTLHDLRMVTGKTHTNLIFDVTIPSGVKLNENELCYDLRLEVKNLDDSYNAVITIDRDYTSYRYNTIE